MAVIQLTVLQHTHTHMVAQPVLQALVNGRWLHVPLQYNCLLFLFSIVKSDKWHWPAEFNVFIMNIQKLCLTMSFIPDSLLSLVLHNVTTYKVLLLCLINLFLTNSIDLLQLLHNWRLPQYAWYFLCIWPDISVQLCNTNTFKNFPEGSFDIFLMNN